jgi:hypothetical protein
MLSEVFYVGLYTSMIGFILALSRQLYKSKCKNCSFCGIKIERDVEGEEKYDEKTLELQQNNNKPETSDKGKV